MPGITAIPDVVDAPTIGVATDAGTGTSVTVAFTAAATGGAATSFTAISTPGSITGSSATSPITVTGLTENTSYTFKVYGANASGTWSSILSSSSNSVVPILPGAFESIATATGTGSAATVTFSSIPSTYKHLQIRYLMKDTENLGSLACNILRLTANSITSYTRHDLAGDGTSAATNSTGSSNIFSLSQAIPTSFNSDVMGVGIIDILDYASTTKNKTLKVFAGADANNAPTTQYKIRLASSVILSTDAITSLSIGIQAGGNLTSNSKIALYGIKG